MLTIGSGWGFYVVQVILVTLITFSFLVKGAIMLFYYYTIVVKLIKENADIEAIKLAKSQIILAYIFFGFAIASAAFGLYFFATLILGTILYDIWRRIKK